MEVKAYAQNATVERTKCRSALRSRIKHRI